jgi:excisionase family DNA binding protein
MRNDESIELLTIQEVAELLRVSASSVRRLQQGRHLPFIKVGGSVRFAKDDVLDFLKKQRVEAIARRF